MIGRPDVVESFETVTDFREGSVGLEFMEEACKESIRSTSSANRFFLKERKKPEIRLRLPAAEVIRSLMLRAVASLPCSDMEELMTVSVISDASRCMGGGCVGSVPALAPKFLWM